jgi:hypothetical protein
LHCKANVDFLVGEQLLDLILARFDQGEPESAPFLVESAEEGGEVFTLDEFGCCDAQALVTAIGKASSKFRETTEEGFEVAKESLSFTGELKGASMEKGDAQTGFQLKDLSADGWLLNAVGDMAGSRADAVMFSDIVEEFEVMDVHLVERKTLVGSVGKHAVRVIAILRI